jgi:hypothetical protein
LNLLVQMEHLKGAAMARHVCMSIEDVRPGSIGLRNSVAEKHT